MKKLKFFNIYEAGGLDTIHPKLLKALKEDADFVNSLKILLKNCLQKGDLPTTWKKAAVYDMFRKSKKSDLHNYRPVSLTCIICKILEKIIRHHLTSFFINIISIHQHGFINKQTNKQTKNEYYYSIMKLIKSSRTLQYICIYIEPVLIQ